MGVVSVTTEGEEGLAASTVETVIQIRGQASSKLSCAEWGIGFDATSAGTALVDLLRQSTDGTATASTKILWDPDDATPSWVGSHHFTAEPTAGDILASYEVPENGGQIIMQYPLGREPVIDSATTSRLALRALTTQACNVVGYLAVV